MRIIKSRDIQIQLNDNYEKIKLGDKIIIMRSEYENDDARAPITDNEFQEIYENFKSFLMTFVDFEESVFLSNGYGGSLFITKIKKVIRIANFS